MPTYCYLDIAIGDNTSLERVIVELFTDKTPKTCENFRQLITGHAAAEPKTIPGTETVMAFKGSSFHRIIPDFMIQGGDYTAHNGTGGHSIYGAEFEDENFDAKCDAAGLLCMANRGANTNGSQFFVTCRTCPHLTGKHVVFGKVVRGMNTVRNVEHAPTGSNDKPAAAVVIKDCGELTGELPSAAAADGDTDPDYPQDCEPALTDAEKMDAAERVRQLGNKSFMAQSFLAAVGKYDKALRYLSTVVATSAIAKAVDDKKLACHSNAAQCYINLQKWGLAKAAADQALAIDASNAKALFRRGTAFLQLADLDEAKADFERCLQLDASNGPAAERLNQTNELLKAKKAKQQANYSKMFA